MMDDTHNLVALRFGMSMFEYSHYGALNRVKTAAPLNTAAAAKQLGVSKPTLLRWIREGKTADVGRDRHNWRVFTVTDLRRIKKEMGIPT
jgi:hypothetical protein